MDLETSSKESTCCNTIGQLGWPKFGSEFKFALLICELKRLQIDCELLNTDFNAIQKASAEALQTYYKLLSL